MEKEIGIEIPKGYEAKIVDNKVVLKPKESEDERIRKELIDYFRDPSETKVVTQAKFREWYDWLIKQEQ